MSTTRVALGEMPRGNDGEFTIHYQSARATTDDDDSIRRSHFGQTRPSGARVCAPTRIDVFRP